MDFCAGLAFGPARVWGSDRGRVVFMRFGMGLRTFVGHDMIVISNGVLGIRNRDRLKKRLIRIGVKRNYLPMEMDCGEKRRIEPSRRQRKGR